MVNKIDYRQVVSLFLSKMTTERYVLALKDALLDIMGELYKIENNMMQELYRRELVETYELVLSLENIPEIICEGYFDAIVSKYENLIK